MINYIWITLVFLGILISIFTGNIFTLDKIILNSTSDAFNIFLKLSFMIIFWNGIFNILYDTGLLKKMTKYFSRFLKFIFPEIDPNSKTMEYISLTLFSNIFGLGVASTSTGLKAFKLMKEEAKDKPTKSMITFLILNISTLTLFPTSIITLRNSYNGTNDFKLIIAIILTTLFGNITGIILDKVFNRGKK